MKKGIVILELIFYSPSDKDLKNAKSDKEVLGILSSTGYNDHDTRRALPYLKNKKSLIKLIGEDLFPATRVEIAERLSEMGD